MSYTAEWVSHTYTNTHSLYKPLVNKPGGNVCLLYKFTHIHAYIRDFPGFFQQSCTDVRAGPLRRLDAKELMLLSCGAGEDSKSPLDSKKIKPVNPKGTQPWIFTERTDTEAPILWPPDVNSWLNGKDPDAGNNWWQEEKRASEDEMVGWHHWLNGHEFEQTPGDTVKDREAWRAAVSRETKSWTQLGNWTTTSNAYIHQNASKCGRC